MTTYLTNLILFGWVFAAWEHFKRKQLNTHTREGSKAARRASGRTAASSKP